MKIETKEYQDKKFQSVQITRLDTKGKILDIQDAVSYTKEADHWDMFEKVVLNVTEYGEGKESINLKHFMDLDDFMVLAKDISEHKTVSFQDYKGSKSDKYSTGYEARVLDIQSWPEGNRGNGAYTLSFSAGAGVPGDKGQVSMAKGTAVKCVKMVISIPEARRAFLYAYNYFISKQTAFIARNYMDLYSR
jgi:hypothetical protein